MRSHFRRGASFCLSVIHRPSRAATRLALVFFLAFSASLVLATPPASAQTYRFSSVRVQGNQYVDSSTIETYAGIVPGRAISASDLNAAYQNVLSSGLFESVEFLPRGNRLVIKVVEFPVINRVNVEGNSRINDETALAMLQSKPRLVFSPATAEADAARLTEAYRAQGRLSATVTPRIIRRSNNRVDLVFEVREGRVTEIERLSFVGNRAFSDRRLRRVLRSKQAGALRALIRQDTFVEDRIAFDKSLLTDFYQSRGYVDFQVLSVASEFSRERNAFFLTFKVREGQKFKFGTATVTSDLPEVDVADFERLLRLRPGATYTPVKVDATIARMEKLALKKGLNLVRVDPKVTRDDRNLTLDIEFRLVRGPRIFVERIDVRGNTTTLDRVIRRQFRIAEGDPFNPREIREAAARIRALGLFESTDVNARRGSTEDRVVVDVQVRERNTGSLTFGAAYNFTTGVGLTAKFSERNFLGRGQTLNFDVVIGLDNANGGMTFIEPAFLGRDLAFRFDGEYRQTQFAYTNYDTKKVLLKPSFTFPISDRARLGLRYSLSRNELLNVDPASSLVLKQEAAAGAAWHNALGYTLSYDSRDGGLNPGTGVLLRVGQDFGFRSNGGRFIKSTATLGAQARVFNDQVTLRATIEGGVLDSLGGVSGLNDRFFLTSANIRGFAPAGIGPRDLTVGNRDALGGNLFAAARLETEFPLGIPQEIGITGGVFFDVASVWGLDDTIGGLIDDTMRIRSSAGVSLFWKTPIGPLRFNFSRALRAESYDKIQNFDLTISTEF